MIRPVAPARASLALAAAFFLAACAQTGPNASSERVPDEDRDGRATIPVAADASVDEDQASGYRLGEGDQIAIQVFDEPDLSIDATVGSRGRIGYSYLGDLTVSGKTTGQIEREITALLADGYLRNPSVNVTVVEYRPFFINGEVRAPGSYPYQPGLTLDRAIALAGGLTDRASTRKMFVMKQGAEGEERRASMSTPIEPGDIVSIQEGFF